VNTYSYKHKNIGKDVCDASINQWGSSGNTGFSRLFSGESTTRSRTDYRGFVMVVATGGRAYPYYVLSDNQVDLNNSNVTVSKVKIEPINRRPLTVGTIVESTSSIEYNSSYYIGVVFNVSLHGLCRK
jgi:hypothetical protein